MYKYLITECIDLFLIDKCHGEHVQSPAPFKRARSKKDEYDEGDEYDEDDNWQVYHMKTTKTKMKERKFLTSSRLYQSTPSNDHLDKLRIIRIGTSPLK